jgi:hypothetical protein
MFHLWLPKFWKAATYDRFVAELAEKYQVDSYKKR